MSLEQDYQALKEQYETKSELVSIMVHQLRTPLSALKWSLKMLLDGDLGSLSDEQKSILSRSHASNDRMIQLVNDILNVDRIEAGELQYHFTPVNLVALLENLVEEASFKADELGVALTLNKPTEMSSVQADEEKIKVVFRNLIDNALKYTPRGGSVAVNIEATGERVKVCVKDTGIGISQEDQQNIFSKFFRGLNATRVESEGSGLGLFVTRAIVRKHSGDIEFTSGTDQGTTFCVSVPFTQV